MSNDEINRKAEILYGAVITGAGILLVPLHLALFHDNEGGPEKWLIALAAFFVVLGAMCIVPMRLREIVTIPVALIKAWRSPKAEDGN